VLPGGTLFYEETLSFERMPNSTPAERDKRILYSAAWMEGAKRKTASCDVVFVDPDNGLEVISVDRQHKQGPKYVFFDELASYLERDQSLIVYHHLCRTGTAEEQINARFTQIKNRLGASRGILALLYNPIR
jgi:hypothetical protein